MEKKTISDYTEAEFLEFVRKICRAEGETEADDDKLVDEFERLTEHPYKNGLIYYPLDGQEDSPEGIVAEVKKWRAENGKPGFKNG
ncbi:bacteriocin immunity protein [Salmonella enterica subsp. enterica]|uniref:bacteriocin immunity protein n=1 Tax=Salmonella enterica TaxID=28901 RepID=UPI00115B1B7C|nr:bacteriocin immunity protein [Salmonella enterica]EDT8777525.1 bacteriocin immunity protein [Salmonella enterica subsp. enterica serovar Panama]EKC4582512.1 bacteriocin immunity protein [Salmonella enterica subsp. enterica]EAS1942996.1 bacteriocin immunity protein [Salmonella enterica]EBA3660264.1 bacteriocin immunity protein [Salmonella enterica]EBA3669474.1 bacteriocin immunity protein [Salmonella enterica]